MQASAKNLLQLARYPGSLVFLGVYIAISLTNLSPVIVFIPLALSGLCLLIGPVSSPQSKSSFQTPVVFSAITLFLLSFIASVIFSNDFLKSINAIAVLFPGLLIAYILTRFRLNNVYVLSWCFVPAVAICSGVIILMFLQSSYADPGQVFRREGNSALVVPNDVLAGVIFAPVVAFASMHSRHPILNLLAACSLATLAIAVYLTESRVSALTIIFMILLYFFLRSRNRFLIHSLITLVMLCAFDLLFDLGLMHNFYLIREENERIGVWLAGLAHWSDHPILGFGPSNFEIAYEIGLQDLSLPDWAVIEPRRVPWAHNLYLEALVERGLLGLITLLLLLGVIFIRMLKHASSAEKCYADFYLFIFIAFCGFVFAGLFEPTIQRIWVANSLFVFLGLACIPYDMRGKVA